MEEIILAGDIAGHFCNMISDCIDWTALNQYDTPLQSVIMRTKYDWESGRLITIKDFREH